MQNEVTHVAPKKLYKGHDGGTLKIYTTLWDEAVFCAVLNKMYFSTINYPLDTKHNIIQSSTSQLLRIYLLCSENGLVSLLLDLSMLPRL